MRQHLSEILDDVRQHVQTNDIQRAEGRRLRQAHRRAGERVYLLDRVAALLHQAQHGQRHDGADAVADEIWRVFGDDDAFTQHDIAKARDGFYNFRQRLARGDDLQQLHVPRRVEEVRSQPVTPEIFAESFRDCSERDARGVGTDDRAGGTQGLHLPQQHAFDLEILRDRLDDPIAVFDPAEVVVEIADGNQARGFGNEERRRARLLCRIEPGLRQAIAHLGVCQRQALALFVSGEVSGNNVEQDGRDRSAGQMRGDARSHGSRAQHGYLADVAHDLPPA